MSKRKGAIEPLPEMVKLMAKEAVKKPHVDAVELLDLLVDLSEVDLPPALLDRVQSAKAALLAQSRGGKKGGAERAKQYKVASNTTKAKILAEAASYDGDRRKRASHIAKKLRISGDNAASYVREVLREAGL